MSNAATASSSPPPPVHPHAKPAPSCGPLFEVESPPPPTPPPPRLGSLSIAFTPPFASAARALFVAPPPSGIAGMLATDAGVPAPPQHVCPPPQSTHESPFAQ